MANFQRAAVAVLLLQVIAVAAVQGAASYNPCCSYPCLNKGICMRGKDLSTYTCDCANLNFYGRNCETPTFKQSIINVIKPGAARLHQILVSKYTKPIFNVINNVEFLSDWFMKKVYVVRANILDTPPLYESEHEYPTVGAHRNHSFYARTLPPVPRDCPTPMGTIGPKKLPDPQLLVEKFFIRKTHRPDPRGSSLIFSFFAQHFTHMFFKTDLAKGPGYTWGGDGIDGSSYYGENTETEHKLRSFKDGKFRFQILNGEEYPMFTKDVNVSMLYPPGVTENNKFAMGHRFFGLLPGLFLYQTIWMREHNRVCDVLKEEHPDWDDERLFQTGKLIIIGETIKIVIEDYVQHLASYNLRLRFRPTVLFGEAFQYSNKINVEFNHIYHWHPLMPETWHINGSSYTTKEFLFNNDLVVKHGTGAFTDALSRQRAGHMTHHNHAAATLPQLKETIKHGRNIRLQSLNNYRRRFNLPAYSSFEDLTGEKDMARELEAVYEDIEAMELMVGVMVEKRRDQALFGETIVEIGGPYSVKGLLANPICSEKYWKPSTFGGDKGFEIINTATLEKLFCANIKGPCPMVRMQVPDWVEGDVPDEKTNFVQESTAEFVPGKTNLLHHNLENRKVEL